MLLKFKGILTCVFSFPLLNLMRTRNDAFVCQSPQSCSTCTHRVQWKAQIGEGGWMVHITWFLPWWLGRPFLSVEVTLQLEFPLPTKVHVGVFCGGLFLASDICKPTQSTSLPPPSYTDSCQASLALSRIFLLGFLSHQIFSPHLIWPAFPLPEVLVSRSLFKELIIVSSIQLIV